MPGEVIQTDGSRLFRTRVNGSDEQYVNPLAEKDGMPGYAVQWMEVDGPLADESTGAGYRLLFGDLPMKRVDAGQPGVALDAGLRKQERAASAVAERVVRRDVAAQQAGGAAVAPSGSSHGRGCFQQSAGDAERLLSAFMKHALIAGQ